MEDLVESIMHDQLYVATCIFWLHNNYIKPKKYIGR